MSSASSSTTTLSPTVESRPEAGPLPSKVGEIGYIAPKSPEMAYLPPNTAPDVVLPARHPADRRDEPAPATPPTTRARPAPTAQNNSGTQSPTTKKPRWSVGGVGLASIFRIVLILIVIGGTGAAWGMLILRFQPPNIYATSSPNSSPMPAVNGANSSGAAEDNTNGSDDDSNNGNSTGIPALSSLVIVHVGFTIIALVQLLFLERCIFHARAERYLYKHGMPRGQSAAPMGFAPWSRPSLPTYAAALAESGVSTGDVEDNLIAIPPPPAYGNTRGSRLLLSGMLRESLIRQLNRSSQRSSTGASVLSRAPMTPREMEEGQRSRPISYDASEEVDNAKRALHLELALATLEHEEK